MNKKENDQRADQKEAAVQNRKEIPGERNTASENESLNREREIDRMEGRMDNGELGGNFNLENHSDKK